MHEVGGAVEHEGRQLTWPAQRQRGGRDQCLRLGLIEEALRGEGHAQLGEEAGGVDVRAASQEHAAPRQPRTAGPGDAPPVRREAHMDSVTGRRLRCDESRDLRQPHGQDVPGQLDSFVDSITNEPWPIGVLRAGEQWEQGIWHDPD